MKPDLVNEGRKEGKGISDVTEKTKDVTASTKGFIHTGRCLDGEQKGRQRRHTTSSACLLFCLGRRRTCYSLNSIQTKGRRK